MISILKPGFEKKAGVYVPNDIGSKTVWDDLATEDLLDAATSAENETQMIEKGRSQIDTLQNQANKGVLLDLGCGYGRIAEQLLPLRNFSAYIGIDSSLSMLKFAQERKQAAVFNTPVDWVYGEIDDIPLQDSSVDTVVVSAVFLHNHKSVTERSVQEVWRVLKPGGKIFVFSSFPNLHTPMGYQVTLYLWLSAWYQDPYRNGPTRYFSKSEIRRFFEAFSTVTFVPYGFAFIPKRILFFPSFFDRIYRIYFANPTNTFLRKLLPKSLIRTMSSHHDLIAKK